MSLSNLNIGEKIKLGNDTYERVLNWDENDKQEWGKYIRVQQRDYQACITLRRVE